MRYPIRHLFLLVSLLGLSAFLIGCGPQLSESDLGTVVFEVPKVAGSEEPYPLPQLGTSQGEGEPQEKSP
jgi:hypothetical protein